MTIGPILGIASQAVKDAQANLQAADTASQHNAPAQGAITNAPAAPLDGTPVMRSNSLPPNSAIPANIALQLMPGGAAAAPASPTMGQGLLNVLRDISSNKMDRNTAVEVLDRDFAMFDTASRGGKQDGLVSADDLRAVRNNPNATKEQRDAAAFLLDHKEVFDSLDTAQSDAAAQNASLNTAQKKKNPKANVDGLISQGDVTSYKGSIPTDVKPKELYNTSGPRANQPSLGDIQQRTWGDCYFLSSMGAMVQQDPNTIKNLIKDNGDGTYTVTLYEKNIVLNSGWTAKPVTVNASDIEVFTSQEGLLTDPNNGKEVIWPAVMEAAYAKMTNPTIVQGGWPEPVLETLTGHAAQSYDPRAPNTAFVGISNGGFVTPLAANLKSQFDSGKPIVMSTLDNFFNNDYNLVGHHAYTVTNVYTNAKDGKTYVALNNPWGCNQPKDIPLENIGQYFCDAAIGTSSRTMGSLLMAILGR